jgi:hypothetical protein
VPLVAADTAPVGIAPRAPSPWLFGSAFDLLFGAGLAYLVTLPLLSWWSGASGVATWPGDVAIFLSIAFASPHYGATLLRVYEHRADRRKYALFAVYASALTLALFGAGLQNAWVGSLVLTAYVTWSPWHFAGQNYGISLLFLRRRGVPIDATAKRLVYASFVLSSALAILAIHTANAQLVFAQTAVDASGAYQVLRFGIPPAIATRLAPLLGVAYAGVLLAATLRLRGGARWSDLVAPALLVATHALWFVLPAIGSTTGAYDATTLAFAPIWISTAHSLQYLWITCFYAQRSQAPVGVAAFLAKATLAGAAITLLPNLLFVPGLLGSSLPHGIGVGVLLFATVNLHHFVLDGAVWKLRDGRVARALLRDATAEDDAADPRRSRRWLRPILFAGGAIALAAIPLTVYERRVAVSPTAPVARVETALDRLAWLGRDGAAAWIGLATRHASEGRADAAIAAYRLAFARLRAMKTLPAPAVAVDFAALLLQHQRASEAGVREALRFAAWAAQIAPDDPRTLDVLADANAAAGDWAAAHEAGSRALAKARERGASAQAAAIERRLATYPRSSP